MAVSRPRPDLSCPACGGNRLRIPGADDDAVTCEECGAALGSLRAAKALIEGSVVETLALRNASRCDPEEPSAAPEQPLNLLNTRR